MERNRSEEHRQRVASGAATVRAGVTDALARSFFDEWARTGYAGLSLECVARTAGVGKAALYRRWPDKPAMAADLLARAGLTITDTDQADTLEADVLALLLTIRRVLRHPRIRRIVADLHAEAERTPALAAAIRPFQAARRARVDAMLDRAVARGELPATVDRELFADLLGAPLYWRIAVLGRGADRAHVERLARAVVGGIRAAS